MLSLLALRNLLHKPWRSALLFLGYGMGVTVMIVLLSIGEALIAQARDEKLVGGGDVTVLPEGLDVEVMKTGGLGGLFFSIDNARFVYHQLLASPRLAGDVSAVAPQIEGKLVYLTTPGGAEIPVRASGEVPSATRAVGAGPDVAAGAWADDDGDRRWARPTPAELRHQIDHFHLPPRGIANAESWAEWHYFNVLSPDRRRWTFVSLMLGGRIPDGEWGGQVLVTTHEQGEGARGSGGRRYSAIVPASAIRFSTSDADLRLGDAGSVTVLPDGRYAVKARVRDELSGAPLDLDLVVTPSPNAYFPGGSTEREEFTSGYAVAALRAEASGTVCAGGGARRCERYAGAQAYHDHNWGVWRQVTWEWGATRAGGYTLLYGRIQPPDSAARTPFVVYVVDSLGFRALFRPRDIVYEDGRTIRVGGRDVRVPSRASIFDARGADTLRLEIVVEDAAGTDTRAGFIERGESAAHARALAHPYFIQMKGTARLSGRIGRQPVAGEGAGFFETYR